MVGALDRQGSEVLEDLGLQDFEWVPRDLPGGSSRDGEPPMPLRRRRRNVRRRR